MSEEGLRAAVAASGLAGEQVYGELLRSIVEVARAIFEAQAASITTFDEESGELVFRAVAGAGSESLVGTRFAAGEGIAGWVLASGEPLIVDDLTRDPRFARSVAQDTGYVPKEIMAAPLLRDERRLGVLSVLDRPAGRPLRAADVDLLALFARQAALALDVVDRGREANAALAGDRDAEVAVRLLNSLDGLDERRRAAAGSLLQALLDLLS